MLTMYCNCSLGNLFDQTFVNFCLGKYLVNNSFGVLSVQAAAMGARQLP
jgi:hypothetical protein